MTGPEPRQPRQELARWPYVGDVLVIVVVTIAAACSYSTTGRWYNVAAVGVGALVLALALAWGTLGRVHRPSIVAAVVIALVPQLLTPPTPNVTAGPLLYWVIGAATVALAVLGLVTVLPRLRFTLPALMAVIAAAMIGIIVESRAPQIDVWVIFQRAAAGLLKVNPYNTTYPGVPAGQTGDCFNYLPATFLVSWPGWALVGDVRYAETGALLAGWVATGLVLARSARGPQQRVAALSLLCLAMVLPGSLRVAQQAWNESLVLGFLLLGTAALSLRRTGWAVLAFGLALATKQHVALLLPLLGLWPMFGWRRTLSSTAIAGLISVGWIVANPARFAHCTVVFFLDYPARFDSISLWHLVPQPMQSLAVLAGLGLGYALCVTRIPRSLGGLLISAAVVEFAFDAGNKQSFLNQWWLVAELALCGLAWHAAELPRGERSATEPPTAESRQPASKRDLPHI